MPDRSKPFWVPFWAHDCNQCTFLGRHEHEGKLYDLYIAKHGDHDSCLARFGDGGSEYLSFPVSLAKTVLEEAKTSPNWSPLAEAYRRAKESGYVTSESANPEAFSG